MSSLRSRYAAKLTSNIVGLAAGFVVVLVVPRALGPAAYGSAEFLVAFFASAVGVVDLGTSNGYYAWLSRRPRDATLVRAYLLFALAIGAVGLAVVFVLFAAGEPAHVLWPNMLLASVLAGSAAAWLAWLQQVMQKTVDARALTTQGELRILMCRTTGAGLLALVAYWHGLTFGTYLGYLVILPFVTILMLAQALSSEEMQGGRMWSAVIRAAPNWQALKNDFRPYVVPMLALSLFGAFSVLLDRWFLQLFGGAVQQGLFSLGSRIAALCFVFTAAMAQLLTREFAIAWERGERSAIGVIFTRYVPPLYAISTVIAVFLAWHAREVVGLLGGSSFSGGATAMVIMAFYPMHQTLGQLSSSVYFGTSTMYLYARIQIASTVFGFFLLWLFVMPHAYGGLGLGATGLALKMVTNQLLGVNTLIFFIARDYGINLGKELRFQLLPFLACLPVAVASGWLANRFLQDGIADLLVSATLYGVSGLALLWYAPWAFGLQKSDVSYFRDLIAKYARRGEVA